MTNTDRRAGRKLLGALQLRMTAEQQERIEARAAARGISASAATRELLDLGGAVEDLERHGLYVTKQAMKLLRDGAAAVQLVTQLNGDELDWLASRGNGWTDNDRDRLAHGAALMATTEEVAHLASMDPASA